MNLMINVQKTHRNVTQNMNPSYYLVKLKFCSHICGLINSTIQCPYAQVFKNSRYIAFIIEFLLIFKNQNYCIYSQNTYFKWQCYKTKWFPSKNVQKLLLKLHKTARSCLQALPALNQFAVSRSSLEAPRRVSMRHNVQMAKSRILSQNRTSPRLYVYENWATVQPHPLRILGLKVDRALRCQKALLLQVLPKKLWILILTSMDAFTISKIHT